MKARDVMTAEVRTCGPDTSLEAIEGMMWDCNCGAIPVTDADGRPLGIITDRDIGIAAALQHKPLWDMRPADVFQGREVIACREDDDVDSVLERMAQHRIRRLPVLDAEGRLCGLVSMDDLVVRAERGRRGERSPELSYEDVVVGLKKVLGESAQRGFKVEQGKPARGAGGRGAVGQFTGAAVNLISAGGGLVLASFNLVSTVAVGAAAMVGAMVRHPRQGVSLRQQRPRP